MSTNKPDNNQRESNERSIIPPRISENIFDGPSQRLITFSVLIAIQSLKLTKVSNLLFSDSPTRIFDLEIAFYRWAFIDILFLTIIWWLRIPRLRFHKLIWGIIYVTFLSFDWLLLGNWNLPIQQLTTALIPTTLQNAFTFYNTPQEHKVRMKDVIGNKGDHLRGEHTVRVGGFSTAKLNPMSQSFCLPSSTLSTKPITIPILFNNTDPLVISYSITSINDDGSLGDETFLELKGKELVKNSLTNVLNDDDNDDLDDDGRDLYNSYSYDELSLLPRGQNVNPPPSLQRTQSIRYLPLTSSSTLPSSPFIVRLKHVVDKHSELDARIAKTDALIVECPSAGFGIEEKLDGDLCVGDKIGLQLGVRSAGGANVGWISRNPDGTVEEKNLSNIGSTTYTSSIDRIRSVSSTTSIPVNLTLEQSGEYQLSLSKLEDFFENKPYPSIDSSILLNSLPSLTFRSHSLPITSFLGCSVEYPVKLLEGGTSSINVGVSNINEDDGPFDVQLKYFNNPDLTSSAKDINVRIPKSQSSIGVPVSQPGFYQISSVNSRYCNGESYIPDVCSVKSIPKPTIDMDIKTIEDCSGEVGIHALMTLTGEAPFMLSYTVEFGNEKSKRVEKKIYSSRDELSLTPEREGKYKYTFLSISDRNYKDIKIGEKGKGITATQVVHPLAGAAFTEPSNKRTVWSCDGSEVDIDVEFKGSGPWNLEYQTTGTSSSSVAKPQTYTQSNIKNRNHKIRVPIPEDIDKLGGQLMVSLVSVEDSRRCKKVLSQNDYTVFVNRVKPTARLVGNERSVILEKQHAQIPVRVTGEGPWRIGYKYNENDYYVTTTKRETDLIVDQKGFYQLISVHDLHCPGFIVDNEDTFELDFIERPSLSLSNQIDKSNKIHTLPPVCKGDDSSVQLSLNGEPPFEVSYKHKWDSFELVEKMASVKASPIVQLVTDVSGIHKYSFFGVGDGNYQLDEQNYDINVEQLVVERPSARFKANSPRLSYCLGDELCPRHGERSPIVELFGTGPWELDIEISEETATTNTRRVHIPHITTREWELNLSPLKLQTFGTHKVTIVGVHDASDCIAFEDNNEDWRSKSVFVDVAESATVVPLDRFEDVCVGDSMEFQLGGSAPWTISYEWNGKPHNIKTRSSSFTRVAESEGLFSINQVSHHSQQCPTNVDIKRVVHSIPSASVSEGNTYIEDIREGDQAEIKFTFVGTPPFTFTYERRENLPRVGRHHELGRVLEKHTITNVNDYEHSIYSSLEGTYVVSFIQDAHCRYPKDTRSKRQ